VLLLNQKRRGEGACTGSCYDGEAAWHARERASEEELGR
jgi:hypothetical protein